MGFMTAEFINYMEKMAYYSAREQYCITERPDEKVAMPELFDMIAGSETGALIGSILVQPNEDISTNATQVNKYWASYASSMFWDESGKLYVDQDMPFFIRLLILCIFMSLISGLVYYCFHRKYRLKPGYEDKIEQLSVMIENYKEIHLKNTGEV
jgi:hypothetical protein